MNKIRLFGVISIFALCVSSLSCGESNKIPKGKVEEIQEKRAKKIVTPKDIIWEGVFSDSLVVINYKIEDYQEMGMDESKIISQIDTIKFRVFYATGFCTDRKYHFIKSKDSLIVLHQSSNDCKRVEEDIGIVGYLVGVKKGAYNFSVQVQRGYPLFQEKILVK